MPNIIDKISMLSRKSGARGQIALEFLVVYSFVLVIFLLMFGIVASQRAASLSQQEYASLQLQTQNIANYIDQALSSGSGYSVTIPITGNIGSVPYNLSVSTTGVVIVKMKIGTQILSSYAFSNSRNLIINGTLQQTGNGISIYLVPTYKGSLELSNINGVIYVGQNPPSVASLPKTLSVTPIANVKVAGFNAQQAYIQLPNSAAVLGTADRSVSFWIDTPGTIPNTGPAPFSWGTEAAGNWFGVAFPNGQHTLDVADWGVADHISATTLQAGRWYNVVITLSSSGTVLGLYINGVSDANFPVSTAALNTQAGPVFIGERNDLCTCARLPSGTQMANFQIYSNTLSSNQILSLYNEGINGAPINTASLVAWLPLNGNMNDYSGNGNNGFAPAFNTINYSTVAQINTHLAAGTANGASNSIVGYISSKGNTYIGNSYAVYTSNTGNSTSFVTAMNNVSIGSANLTVDGFNGNSSLNGNLLAWWPLTEGYGTKAHDLSTHYLDGNFIGPIWTPLIQNQTNFAAGSFPGKRSGLIGNNAVGFITVNQVDQYLNLQRNDSFTATMWIDLYGAAATHDQGLLTDWLGSSGGSGIVMTMYANGANTQLLLNVNTSSVLTNANVPINSWQMITAEYNGSTGIGTIYFNNTQQSYHSYAAFSKGLSLSQATVPYYIGDDSWAPNGADNFNGLITNVQLYSTYLTPTEVNSLYRQGISSTPIADAGLVGWWPLNGNANDYSSNGNNGIKNFNVTFVNSQFTAKSNSTVSVVTFNGNSGAYLNATFPNTAAQGSGIYIPQGDLTFDMWFRTTSPSGGLQVVGLQSGGSPIGGGCDRSVWLNNGIINFNAWSEVNFNGITTVNDGRWHNLAYVLNQTNGFYTFLDGQPYASSTTATGNCGKGCSGFNSANSYTIGNGLGCRGGSTNGGPFNGQIADAQIYNSVLTQYQIQQLYLQGLPIYKKLNISLG
ncbi:MAG: laminin G domain-containing protein [Candidatus Micrarchaeota archaeon]|nr:laminin G domain-containing protein [Candidatus Micrarchaeota archaeon]